MKRLTKSEKRDMIGELKDGAMLARTFIPHGKGEEKVTGYEIRKYSIFGGRLERGLMFQVLKSGEKLEIISAHEDGEPINSGEYNHQRDLAIRYARQEGVSYGEVDLDLAMAVIT